MAGVISATGFIVQGNGAAQVAFGTTAHAGSSIQLTVCRQRMFDLRRRRPAEHSGAAMKSANVGPLLQPGDGCSQDGAYEATHTIHREPHTVMVRKGEIFPRCNQCSDAVRFRLVRSVGPTPEDPGPRIAKRKRAGHGS